MNLTTYFQKFFHSSQSSGILLLLCVAISLILANTPAGETFGDLLQLQLGAYTTSVWINDGLMAIFFLLVGLEIKREIVEGELSSFKNASLPIFAALGGMVVPAGIFAFFNAGTVYVNGWGIPMATDIAFSLAIVALLGSRVPPAIKIFLAALAIVDDLGAILVIAIFYTDQLHWNYLLLTAITLVLLAALNYFKVTRHMYYLVPGVFLWYFMHHSGIHATIAGVLLAFCIPTNSSPTEISPLEKLEHRLHLPVNFFIMPLFALANTNIIFKSGMVEGLFSTLGYGIILGLVLGKVIGICLFSGIAIKAKFSSLPAESNWRHMIGTGFLAGIGFTMSIFIALLSYKGHAEIQEEAKFAILIASAISGITGFVILKYFSGNGDFSYKKN